MLSVIILIPTCFIFNSSEKFCESKNRNDSNWTNSCQAGSGVTHFAQR